MELKAVTTKTGFANRPVIDVERIHRVIRVRNATEKWKENDYYENEKLTTDEREAVSEEISKDVNTEKGITPQEAYEIEISKYNPIREKLMGKSR